MILETDVVINVVSGLSLDRDLFLTLQLIDMGKRVLLVVNQWDEAVQRGMKIDLGVLSAALGVPVIKCVAVTKEGLEDIDPELPTRGNISPELVSLIEPIMAQNIDPANCSPNRRG